MSIPKTVSIIVATHNRAESLKHFLKALEELQVPEDVICSAYIVDNGSTDGTAEILASVQLPNLQLYTLQYKPGGKSACLNYAISLSKPDVYLFTDDDVFPPANWIAEITEPIFSGESDCAAGGIRVAAKYEGDGLDPYSCLCLGDTRHTDRSSTFYMIGANMAISKKVMEHIGGFNEDLGPGRLGTAEETLFSMQAMRAGFRIADRMEVIAEHHFDAHRLTARSYRKRFYTEGLCRGYIAYHWEHKFLSQPKKKVKDAIRQLKMWRLQNAEDYKRENGLNPAEGTVLINIGYARQYAREKGKPRLYPFEKSGALPQSTIRGGT